MQYFTYYRISKLQIRKNKMWRFRNSVYYFSFEVEDGILFNGV